MNKCKGCSADFTHEHELHIHLGSGDNFECKEKYTSIEVKILLKAFIDFRNEKKSKDKKYVKIRN